MYNNMIKLFIENAFMTFIKQFELKKIGFTAGGPMGDYNYVFWDKGTKISSQILFMFWLDSFKIEIKNNLIYNNYVTKLVNKNCCEYSVLNYWRCLCADKSKAWFSADVWKWTDSSQAISTSETTPATSLTVCSPLYGLSLSSTLLGPVSISYLPTFTHYWDNSVVPVVSSK